MLTLRPPKTPTPTIPYFGIYVQNEKYMISKMYR